MTDTARAEATATSASPEHVEHFEPLDPALPNRYWEYSDGLRATRPVVRSDGHWSTEDTGFWLLSRHDDVFGAAADWQTYSSANGATPVQFPVEMFRMIPLEVDPPLHRHVRRLLNPFFTPEAVAAAEQAAGSIADALPRCAPTADTTPSTRPGSAGSTYARTRHQTLHNPPQINPPDTVKSCY